jgi:hypothetical protein
MPLVVTYVPLIKYYQFIIHIKLCRPQIGSQCYIKNILNIYIGGTSRYSSLYALIFSKLHEQVQN